jgi:hypothetical protein
MHGIQTSPKVQFKLLCDLVNRAGGRRDTNSFQPQQQKKINVLVSCTEFANSELSMTKTLLLQSAPHFGTQTYKSYSTITMRSDGGHTARRWIMVLSLPCRQYHLTQWDTYVILKIRRKNILFKCEPFYPCGNESTVRHRWRNKNAGRLDKRLERSGYGLSGPSVLEFVCRLYSLVRWCKWWSQKHN